MGKDCAPLEFSGLGCCGAGAGWFGTGAVDGGGAAEADCWRPPLVLFVTAVMKRRAASSLVVTAPVAISPAETFFFR